VRHVLYTRQDDGNFRLEIHEAGALTLTSIEVTLETTTFTQCGQAPSDSPVRCG
jgi:hypothetical protein